MQVLRWRGGTAGCGEGPARVPREKWLGIAYISCLVYRTAYSGKPMAFSAHNALPSNYITDQVCNPLPQRVVKALTVRACHANRAYRVGASGDG